MNIQADINKRIIAMEVNNRVSAEAFITAVLSERKVKGGFDISSRLCRSGKINSKDEALSAIKNYK